MFPTIYGVIQQSSFNGIRTNIDVNCSYLAVQRNDRNFKIRACRGNTSILVDGNVGEFDFTDGLQIKELQAVYIWDVRQTPEDPFMLFIFATPVIITRIVVTLILSQNDGADRVPTITMFVSNTNPSYPRRSIPVSYNDSDAPATGVYRLNLVPNVSESFRFWCVDMKPPAGTNWVIVSEVELYQEPQGKC